ncbi:VOC family protein [Pollutibacter soli]|uniref:VOC family protein n=1 Tax=Pollutibacter soli TaxID=3034157 RepID=UPI003013B3F1
MRTVLIAISIFCFSATQVYAQEAKARLNHIAFYVTDLKVSTDFYMNLVGLDSIPEPFHDGLHTWLLIGPKSHLHLIVGGKQRFEHHKHTHLCFTVASVEDFAKKLNDRKIYYEDWPGKPYAITTRVDGVKQLYLKDPDGYWIEINDARE